MNYIYSGAQETCIWLGKEADESDLAMGLIALTKAIMKAHAIAST